MIKSILLYAIMLALAIASAKRKKGGIVKNIGFRKTEVVEETKYALSTLFLLFTASLIIGLIFFSIGLSKDASIVRSTLKEIPLSDILIVLVIGSITEEIFFRGYIQKKTNITTASFIFAYFHIIYGSLTEVVGAFFLGLILGYAFEKRKNLYAPTLAHLLYNLITVSILNMV